MKAPTLNGRHNSYEEVTMGYEGYDQRLCAAGHYHASDVWASPEEEKCPRCGGESVWRYGVDETNDMGHPMLLVPRNGGHSPRPECPVRGKAYLIPTEDEMRLHDAAEGREYDDGCLAVDPYYVSLADADGGLARLKRARDAGRYERAQEDALIVA